MALLILLIVLFIWWFGAVVGLGLWEKAGIKIDFGARVVILLFWFPIVSYTVAILIGYTIVHLMEMVDPK